MTRAEFPTGDSMIAATALTLKAVCVTDYQHIKQIKEIQTHGSKGEKSLMEKRKFAVFVKFQIDEVIKVVLPHVPRSQNATKSTTAEKVEQRP